jgi:hypothetical protein
MYTVFYIRKYLESFKKAKQTKSLLQIYNENITSRFSASFEKSIYNSNIDDIFYDKKKFSELVKIQNDYEDKWRRNILYKYVPREDNKLIHIIMYYDVYKGGFAYYCDENYVSYTVLNNVAMQYVLCFQCRDFFIDELICLENNCISPLIEKQKQPNKNNKNSRVCMDYIHSKNKFIYLGKIRNFSFLNKIHLASNNICRTTETIRYKDFKNLFN